MQTLNQLPPVAIAYDLDGPETAAEVATGRTKVVGLAYAIEGEEPVYVSVDLAGVLSGLGDRPRIYNNAVHSLALEMQNDLPLPSEFHDTHVMQHLLGEEPSSPADISASNGTLQRAQEILAQYQQLQPRLAAEQLDRVYREIELPVMVPLVAMTLAGCPFDHKALEELKEYHTAQAEIASCQFQEIAGEALNLDDDRAIAEYLHDDLPAQAREKLKLSVSKAALELFAEIRPGVANILAYREHHRLAKEASDYLNFLDEASCIHAELNSVGTVTGRISAAKPALQSLDARLRKAVAAASGHLLLEADYSQMELCVLAHFSQDTALLDAIQTGADLHRRTAALALGIPEAEVTDKQRQIGKTLNFALVFGQTPHGLAKELGVPIAEAELFLAKYYAGYPGVEAWISTVHQQVASDGEVRTLFGRRRLLPDANSYNQAARAHALRQAVNTIIQGTAADLLKLALIRLHDTLPADVKMLLPVHDSVLLEVPEGLAVETSQIVSDAMEAAPTGFTAPLKVDIKTGRTWADCK